VEVAFSALMAAVEGVQPRNAPLCRADEAWFGQNFGAISDGQGPYDDSFKCRWTVDGQTATVEKNLCIRFDRFDVEDSRACKKTVIELTVGNDEPERFCQTLGADRDRHKRMRMGHKTFNLANPRKARNGANFLTWTCLDASSVQIQMASHPGANFNGNYQGFELVWATESSTTLTDMQNQIADFGANIDLFSAKKNRRTSRQFGKLMSKLNRELKQGRVVCTAQMAMVPEFMLEKWEATKTANSVAALSAFLRDYLDMMQAGCYRRFDKLNDIVLQRFLNRL